MLEDAPIPCVACDGSMVRASWLVRPAIACEKATAGESQPIELPDGRMVKIKSEAEARSIESHFEGIAITRSAHEMNQEAAIKRADAKKEIRQEYKNMYAETLTQINNEGTSNE